MQQNILKLPEWSNKSFSTDNHKDLVHLSDDELCQRSRKGCVSSRNLLWHRYQDFVLRIICRRTHQYRLPSHEIADARQELYFAFHQAVQRYDPQAYSRGKPASFKTFLGVIVVRLLLNYCRRWRRYNKRIILNLTNELSASFVVDNAAASADAFLPKVMSDIPNSDLRTVIITEFSSDHLATVLSRLKLKETHLLETWLQHGRDKEVAKVLGISTVAAKLRRERLFQRIKQGVGEK